MNKHNFSGEALEKHNASKDTLIASFPAKLAEKVAVEDEVKVSSKETILVKEIARDIEPNTIHLQGVIITSKVSRPAARSKPKKPVTKPSGAVELQVSAKIDKRDASTKKLHCGGKHEALLLRKEDDSFVLTINGVEKNYHLYHGAIAAYKRHVASQDAYEGKQVSFHRGIVQEG